MADNDRVKIFHPSHGDSPGIGEVTRAQYNEIYALQGWKIVDPVEAQVADLLGGKPRSVKDLTQEEAVTLASRLGAADVTEKSKKADLEKAITDALTTSEVANG